MTMTIYFHPRYDSSVFLTEKDCGLGKAYCGTEALMAELELRAGLTCAETDHPSRVISYMEAMEAALGMDPDLFYQDSFRRDDFGTAELMLGWRDALVKAGWDGSPVGDSEKISVLSLIESCFCCPGSADRWRALLAEARKRPILRSSDNIEVQCRRDDLDPLLQALLDAIGAHSEVKYLEPGTIEDGKIKIIDFDNEYTAHEWITAQELGGEDVVAEADPALLGDFLRTAGKPGIGAADSGIGAVMRLLPLGLSLFRYPADIAALQSYLQAPRSPFGKLHCECDAKDGSKYYASASRLLFSHICSEGGFGSGWNEIIDKALLDFDGTPLDKAERDEALQFLTMWEQSRTFREGEAPVNGVEAFMKGLSRWAGRSVSPDSPFNAQFQALQRYCGAMLRLLGRVKGDAVPVSTLIRWASHICVPIDISSNYPRLGSMNVVGNIADIYSEAGRLIWFAATTDSTLPYDYDFLSPGEIADLQGTGVLVSGKEQLAAMDKAYRTEGLSRCRDVTIVTCRRISGQETLRSALLAELEEKFGHAAGTPVLKTESDSVVKDFGKAAKHTFDPAILNGFKREEESYSSINTLLMSPVDYLLDYVKGYRQYGIDEIADIETTEGIVAHAYIEALGKECGKDPEEMLTRHEKEYEAILGKVMDEKGLILYLEENYLERESFRVSLGESVRTLLDIIITNKLEIIGFEHRLEADLPNIGPVVAVIDCLLRDPSDGQYVIIDFKYSHGKTYLKKIEECRELQLAIYRKEVEANGNKVKFVGYYAIPRKKLYTPDDSLNHPAIEIVQRESAPDLFDQAAKGYLFRMEQLRQGIAEEGEDLQMQVLDYFRRTDLYPLEVNYEDKNKKNDGEKRKARAYGDKNITLKGGLS